MLDIGAHVQIMEIDLNRKGACIGFLQNLPENLVEAEHAREKISMHRNF